MSKELQELMRQDYWDSRYSAAQANAQKDHEWFRSFDDIKDFLLSQLTAAPQILHLGCGTSDVTAKLYDLGFVKQTSIDFSPECIATMREAHKDKDLQWEVMDVRDLDFAAGSFDYAIDKGTLDVFLWGSLWDPEDSIKANVKAYIDSVVSTLRPGGKLLYITSKQPHFIRPLLTRDETWTVEHQILGGGGAAFEYFAYIATKFGVDKSA